MEEQEKRYLDIGSHYWARGKHDAREILRNLQGWPQLKPLANSGEGA